MRYVFPLLLFIVSHNVCGQSDIFELFEGDKKLADKYFKNGSYTEAIAHYKAIIAKNKDNSHEARLKIAQANYHLRNYYNSSQAYTDLLEVGLKLSPKDLYYYAETLAAVGDYSGAIQYYRSYLDEQPNDAIAFSKIWRLSNRSYLFEDSAKFSIRQLSFNTAFSEMSAVAYRNGVVFMSDQPTVSFVKRMADEENSGIYNMKFAPHDIDTLQNVSYGDVIPFNKNIDARFHIGPVSFYNAAKQMVFAAVGRDNSKTIKLYFAIKNDDKWETVGEADFNSDNYSCSDPSVSADGKVLYFSSDMPGGVGQRDLYRSVNTEGKWGKPTNLGPKVNTPYDEVFPFIQSNVLYFSSDGQPGLGGLDIFKVDIYENNEFGEVENMGYPVNSMVDDFGIYLDSTGRKGFISSNRDVVDPDDDNIFAFESDLQTYPLTVTGKVKYLDRVGDEEHSPEPLADAKLYLIDKNRNITIVESMTDGLGGFTMEIPYYSSYILRVEAEGSENNIVSFEVPKYAKNNNNYEVVVVKEN